MDTLPGWAGWKAWYEIDKVRSHLAAFRVLDQEFGQHPEFQAALQKLAISENLRAAYLDAAELFRQRGF